MHKEELQKLLRDRPFRPFRVFTTDGTAILIWHPDFAYLSPGGRTLHVYQRDGEYDMLDVALLPRFAFDALPEDNYEAGTPASPPPTSA
jgi:hypothetical protein